MYDPHNILLADRAPDWLESLREARAFKPQKPPPRPRASAKPRKPTKFVQSLLDKGIDLETAQAIAATAKESMKKGDSR